MKARLTFTTLALVSYSALALAQTTVPSGSTGGTAPPAAHSGQGMSTGGMKMADTATVGLKFVTVKPADFMASKLIGTNVYNNQNESIGEIQDVVIDNGKIVTGVVVSVGGFLGMGESYVVLDPATVVLNHKDGAWKAFVDTTKDSLKDAPKFAYKNKS